MVLLEIVKLGSVNMSPLPADPKVLFAGGGNWRAIADKRGFSSWLWSSFLFSRSCALSFTQHEGHAVGLNPRRPQQSPVDSSPVSSTTHFPANSCEVVPRNLTTPSRVPQNVTSIQRLVLWVTALYQTIFCLLASGCSTSAYFFIILGFRDAFAVET